MARRIFNTSNFNVGNSSLDPHKIINANPTGFTQLSSSPTLAGIMKSSPPLNNFSSGWVRRISQTKLPETSGTPQDKFKQPTTDQQLHQPTSEMSIDIELHTMRINLTELTPMAAAQDTLDHLKRNLPQMNPTQRQQAFELVRDLSGCFEKSTHADLLDQIEKELKK